MGNKRLIKSWSISYYKRCGWAQQFTFPHLWIFRGPRVSQCKPYTVIIIHIFATSRSSCKKRVRSGSHATKSVTYIMHTGLCCCPESTHLSMVAWTDTVVAPTDSSCWKLQVPSKHDTLNKCLFNVGPTSWFERALWWCCGPNQCRANVKLKPALAHLHVWSEVVCYCNVVQIQEGVSAYFTNNQIPPFGFAEQCTLKVCAAWLTQTATKPKGPISLLHE